MTNLDFAVPRAASEAELSAIEASFSRPLPSALKSLLRQGGGTFKKPRLCEIPDASDYPESFVEITSLADLADMRPEDHVRRCKEWGYPVVGFVLDPLDAHRAVVVAMEDSIVPVGAVVLIDTDWHGEPSEQVIPLAANIDAFLSLLQAGKKARRAHERGEPDAIDLARQPLDDAAVAAALQSAKRKGAVRRISLAVTGAGVLSLRALPQFRELTALDLTSTPTRIEDLAPLVALSQLAHLTVTSTRIHIDGTNVQRLVECCGWITLLTIGAHQVDESARRWLAANWPGLDVSLLDVPK